MPVEKQVLILYALINKHLIDVDCNRIREFQREFLAFIDQNKRFIPDQIRETGDISPELEQQILNAIAEFKELHDYSQGGAPCLPLKT